MKNQKTITISSDITYFSQIEQLNPIPSRTVIDKTLTGIGATFSEITCKRNSILILPNVATIIGKHEFHKDKDNTFAVHERVSKSDLEAYLSSNSGFKKILTTPEGFINKVKKVLGDRMYKDYFLLIDEAHKLTTDTCYRANIILPMDDFFQFENQAMISATSLIPKREERFDKNGFTFIKIQPTYAYQKPITIVKTYNPLHELLLHIKELPAENYCIFFNSIQGIVSLIDKMHKVGGLIMEGQYKIHCSKESTDELSKQGETNVANSFGKCAKYNFFTSSFFNGLDMPIEAEVIIISDVKFASQSAANPSTDVWQIVGRFRNCEKNVTHLVKTDRDAPGLSEVEVDERISTSGKLYQMVEDFSFSAPGQLPTEVYTEVLKRIIPYANLLDRDKSLNCYKVANLVFQEEVKGYYHKYPNLINAYQRAKHFIPTYFRNNKFDSTLEMLEHSAGKYTRENYRIVTDWLWETEGEPGLYHNQLFVTELYQHFPLIVKAYFKLGIEFLLEMCYNHKLIQQAVALVDFIEGINHHPLIDAVHAYFTKKQYTIPEIDEGLKAIYNLYDIKEKAKTSDISIWFETDVASVVRNKKRVYRLLRPKQNGIYLRP